MQKVSNSQVSKKPSFSERRKIAKQKRKGTFSALMANYGLNLASVPLSIGAGIGMQKINKGLTKDEVNIVNKTAQEIIDKTSNLASKGVKIKNVQSTNPKKTFINILSQYSNPVLGAQEGKNAFFSQVDIPLLGIEGNTVTLNQQKLPLAAFHEMGHAHNFHYSKLLKSMQGARPLMYLAALLALIPIFTRKETPKEGQNELTKGQKIKNKIRDLAPVLSFSCYAPMLIEEGVATAKGNSWAKQVLGSQNKSLYKKVFRSNAVAYMSYLAIALTTAVGCWVGKKVKDNIQQKAQEQAKNEAQAQAQNEVKAELKA